MLVALDGWCGCDGGGSSGGEDGDCQLLPSMTKRRSAHRPGGTNMSPASAGRLVLLS